MSSSDNYIETYVMSLPGVQERRTFDEETGQSGNASTYGNRTAAIQSINKNKAKDKNSDRLKEIHRKAIREKDTSTTPGQIWVEMDQDDERMNRYLFPDRTNNIRDLTAEINDIITQVNTNVAEGNEVSAENQKVIDLIELLTTKTIAPSGKEWTLYGTDKPLYGYKIESIDLTQTGAIPTEGSIIAQINAAVDSSSANYDDAINSSFTEFTLPGTTPKAPRWTDGDEANRKIGLSFDYLNIYSYVEIKTANTSTGTPHTYYYIPTQANYTTTVTENKTNFIYYHQLYPRYHIVDSDVNNMSHPNAYQYPVNDSGGIDITKLGKKFILNVGESNASDISTSLTFEYGDYYKVGRTVWMVSRSAYAHNTYLKDHQTEVRSVRLNAIKTKDSLQTKPGQIWVKMNKNDPRNSKYYYPEITPIKWTDTGSSVRPTVGRDLSNVLEANAKIALLNYINGNTFSLGHFVTLPLINDIKFNYDDYILNTEDDNNYWVINYEESRQLAEETLGTPVKNFLKDNTIIKDGDVDTSYILNSKTDFDTQNILMDSKLVKQYGDTYVLLNNTDIPANIKYGDYYDSDSTSLFGYKWILTNQTKKLDYGRELYDSDLTNILRSLLPTTITSVSALSYKAIESTTDGTWYLTQDDGNNWIEVAETSFTSYTSGDTLIEYDSNYYTVFTNNAISIALSAVDDSDYTILTDTQKDTIANIGIKIELTESNFNIVFTQNDLDNLNIKSLDYIYVATADDGEDIYYKVIENNANAGVFDGKKWKLIQKGDVPNYGRELYHQNLSDLLTSPTNDIVTLTANEYTNHELNKLNLQTSDYIIGADNTTAYRPMPIYVWLAVRSTENQHIYDKHHQITINDTKNEALNIKQTSDVPGQIWKKMSLTDARNSRFYYPVITPLHWKTYNNGATKPEKGRDLSEVLNDTQLSELVSYVNTEAYDLDTFNNKSNIRDLLFYYDDYVLNTEINPNKYYTIDYNNSRTLNDARLNNHTSKTSDELKEFLVNNNFEGYKENYNYPFDKYYVNIINSTRDSKTNRIIVYGDEYVLLDHRDVPNRIMNSGSPEIKPNNIKYGDFYLSDNGNDIWLAIRSNDAQYAFNNIVDTNIKEIRNTAKDIRRTTGDVGKIWIKMLENDKRMSKYNFENMIDGTSRPYYVWKSIEKPVEEGYWITKDNGTTWNTASAPAGLVVQHAQMETYLLTATEDPVNVSNNNLIEVFRENTMQPLERFLKNNINILDDNSLQKSYIVDSQVDSKTNRITKYGNEYIVFENNLIPNQENLEYGQYYLPEKFEFGTKWSLIGTERPTTGRLLIIDDITSQLNGSNIINVDTTASHEIINGINISIQNRLDELKLTPDDYIEGSGGTTYYKAVPPYRWLVTRSDDEDYHYKIVRDIKLKDVLHEAEKIRQASTRIGQIWVVMDSTDERISLTKIPNRRRLNNTITAGTQFKNLLDTFDTNVSVNGYREEFKVDDRVYTKNRYCVVDSVVDKNTYEITYDNDATNRSGLGSTLVLLDTRDIPQLNANDEDQNGATLRYGDYYVRNEGAQTEKWVVVMRSHDVQHAVDDANTARLDEERLERQDNDEASALQNDYQFSVIDDRIGRLWQEVTAVPILDSNKKLIEHDATEELLDEGKIELTREELNTLLSDFTFTKILSTKYMQHTTLNNAFYVTTDNGTNWQEVSTRPVVGTQVYHAATSVIFEGGTRLTLTPTELNALTTAIDSDFDSNVYDIFTDTGVQSALDDVNNGDYTILTAQQKNTVVNASTSKFKAIKSTSTTENKWYLTEDNGDNWIVKVTGIDPIIVNSETIELDIDNHNGWQEHNKRNRYYTTQYLRDGTDYFISNDYGYNWVKVTLGDIRNTGSGNTNMGYEIVHQPTLDILTNGRLLLTSSELDALLNMSKYASDHAITQSDSTSLAGEYVSHRLLTRYHYLKSGSTFYIPGKYINEDYKNYISFPGKGKLGRYWRLRNINYIGDSYITGTDLTILTMFRDETLIKNKAIQSSTDNRWYVTDTNGDYWNIIPNITATGDYTVHEDEDIVIYNNGAYVVYYSIIVNQETLDELDENATLTTPKKLAFAENTKILNKAIQNNGIYYLTTDNGNTWIKTESGQTVDLTTSMIEYKGIYYKDVTNIANTTLITNITSLSFNNWTEITQNAVVDGVDANAKLANFTKFMNILEGNDGSYDSSGNLVTPDPERDSNLEPRLVLTQAERNAIFGSSTPILETHYVEHRVNAIGNANIPDVYYISQDNGFTWQKLTQVSDVSVEMSNTRKKFNNIEKRLGEKIKAKFDANTTDNVGDGILNLNFEDFVNYEVESNVRENSYIVEGVFVFVPGQYVNEEYIYYPSAHEYPSKNDLGRIWMNVGTDNQYLTDAGATRYENPDLETLLSGFSSDNNNVTTVTIGSTNYEIFSISYQEYANNNVNNISELKYVSVTSNGTTNYYIPGRYINDYNDYYPLSPA